MTTANGREYRLFWFSEVLKLAIRTTEGGSAGKPSDLVFNLSDPYPEAAGICIKHGRRKPSAFVPWDKVIRIEQHAIVVELPEGEIYPPFVDQPGWMLVSGQLMGKTILDTDGRKIEVVNDVHLLKSGHRLIIVEVDTSLNGFFRKWGFGNLRWIQDRLISWRYVQPFSIEDAARGQTVSLSVTREQARDLPGEDLADVLEVLHGDEQEAFFSSLDAEKAAETLMHTEPRARRQLMEDLSEGRAAAILEELSIPQLADLFGDLPLDDVTQLMPLLPADRASKVTQVLREDEVKLWELMSSDYLSFPPQSSVAEALRTTRYSGLDPEAISYLYVVTDDRVLTGVIDVRELILAKDAVPLSEIMSTSVVSVERDKTRRDIDKIFHKYHFRMIPVVDGQDHLLGVIRSNDLIVPDQNE